MTITEVGIYTVDDLHAYREERPNLVVQLVEGELVVAPGPSVEHQSVLGELFLILSAAISASHKVLPAPLDLRVGERTVIQPDLMVVPRTVSSGQEVEEPPVLVVEILSPSSRGIDLVRKPEVLAQFGVQHYWVIDPLNPSLRVFRLTGQTSTSGQVVVGDEPFETQLPFPVSFRPADLIR
ncbi:Uma2 family endonuclease [Ornithinimicrobium sp. Y1694]|uniref:Uma2 family endonuclease n=1 Tax=Ornithinimicrobium sp. Y1694 TaxID=3418590 RepID=UPI003CF6E2CF